VAIAAPFDRHGLVAGSIGVFGCPEVRLASAKQLEIAQLLKDQAAKLSEALGFEGSDRKRA